MPRTKDIAQWDAESTFTFLTLLVEHAEKNLGKTPKNPIYAKWVGILKASCNKDYSIDQLKSKVQRMRLDYMNTNVLKFHTGLGWDDNLQRVVCTESQWNDFAQGNKAYDHLRNGLPHYDMYDIVWGTSNATGNMAAPSANPHMGREEDSPSYAEGDVPEDTTMHTLPRSGDKRPGTSDRTQNKRSRGKQPIPYEDSISAIATAIVARQERDVTSKESRQSGPTTWELLDEVVDVVTAMPEFDCRQKVKALQFLKSDVNSQKMFIKFDHPMRVAYVLEMLSA